MDDTTVHCWISKMEWIQETYGHTSQRAIEYELSLHEDNDPYKKRGPGEMCMLPKGHDGPHVFTPNDRIGVVFD